MNNFIDHKCLLTNDENGKKIISKIESYQLMDSGKNSCNDYSFLKSLYNLKYIGFGECYSCYDIKLQRTILISGIGHFWA